MSIVEYIIAWLSANAGKLIWLAAVIIAAIIISKLVSRGLRTLLDRSQVPSASIFINLVPVFAVLQAALLLGERLGLAVLAGGALVIAGVWLTSIQKRVTP